MWLLHGTFCITSLDATGYLLQYITSITSQVASRMRQCWATANKCRVKSTLSHKYSRQAPIYKTVSFVNSNHVLRKGSRCSPIESTIPHFLSTQKSIDSKPCARTW